MKNTIDVFKIIHPRRTTILLAALFLLSISRTALAQGTAFTYQGELSSGGSAANGVYDLRFTVYDSTNSPGNIIAGPITNAGTAVSNGLCCATLDFGTGVFTGAPLWLQVDARTNGATTFTTLLPRQPILPVPYSVMASSASNLLGTLPTSQLSGTLRATNLTGTISLAQLPSVVVTNNETSINLSGIFSGNGAGLTGVPGSVSWQNVTGTSQLAQPNSGYIANNGARVTITLPAAPNVGDMVRVWGAGLGGWRIAQNAGQMIWGAEFGAVTITNWNDLTTNWTRTSAPTELWNSIACSADGVKLAATWGRYAFQGQSAGGIYTSVDCGLTWTQCSVPNTNFAAIACSADGTKLAAVVGGSSVISYTSGGIYISTNAGTTWNQTSAPTSLWTSIASSSDGTRLAAASYTGLLYVSTNGGLTWVSSNGGGDYWTGIASSADGTKLTATSNEGLDWVMTTTNAGQTWVIDNIPGQIWAGVASSADGTRLATAGYPNIYVSTNSGTTWTQSSAPTSAEWYAIGSSADGSKLIGAEYYNGISNQWGAVYVSTNYGGAWTQASVPSNLWQSVTVSADGTKLAAVNQGGGIWTSQATIQATTTPGTGGNLTGGQGSAIELLYTGNGRFATLSHEGAISAY